MRRQQRGEYFAPALDALNDTEHTYPVDSDHVFVSGYSMGGWGTLHFAEAYPDRFAGYNQWVGFTGDDTNGGHLQNGPNVPYYYRGGAAGDAVDLIGNLVHVPGSSSYGGADELVHAWTTEGALRQALQNAAVPFMF
jgi:poly(3-hydroxybutyrate) depolymerase